MPPNLYFEILFRAFPFLLAGIAFYVFLWFKQWIKVWDISENRLSKILFVYKILIIFFSLPWLIFTILGPINSSVNPPQWFKLGILYPAYIWHLTNISLFLILVPTGIILSAFWVYRKISKHRVDQGKRKWLRKSAITMSGLLLPFHALSVYSSEYTHVINKVLVKIDNLPENLKGMKIVQISDLHFGPFMDSNRFSVFSKEINLLKPDMIVLTGDLINSSPSMIKEMMKAFTNINYPPAGIYACLGNHEYFTGTKVVINSLNKLNINVLVDDVKKISYREKEFYIMGVDYPMKSAFNWDKREIIKTHLSNTLSKVENRELPKILLAHHPDTFYESKEQNIDLTLSGHTHGGQIVLGNDPKSQISLGQIGFKYVKGLYTNDNKHLYVNSGLGHWLPMRFNCPPEITQIVLQ